MPAADVARQQHETAMCEKIQAGALSYDLHGLRAVVEGREGEAANALRTILPEPSRRAC